MVKYMNEMVYLIRRFCPYLIFILISLTPFYWLKESFPIAFGESVITGIFYPNINYLGLRYVWFDLLSTGWVNAYILAFLPISIFYSMLKELPFVSSIIQAILLSLITLLTATFSYLFVLELFPNRFNRKRIAFFAAIFYTLNFSSLFYFYYRFVYWLYVLPFAPLFLFLLIRGLRRGNFLYAFFTSLSTAIFSVVFLNPAYGILVLCIGILFYLMFYRFRRFRFIGYCVATFFLLNSFWIIPYAYFSLSMYHEASTIADIMGNFAYSTNVSELPWVLTLTPPASNIGWAPRFTPWKNTYYTPYFIILSFIVPIITFISLLERTQSFESRKNKRVLLFFSFITLTGLFLAKSGNEPLGFLMMYAMKNVPFMGIFRVAVEKFQILIIVGYSVLFGYSINFIYEYLAKRKKIIGKTIVLLILLFFAAYSFPFWTGWIVTSPSYYKGADWALANESGDGKTISVFTEVPEYYFELKEYLRGQEGRILSLPLLPLDSVIYEWEHGYQGTDFLEFFLERPTFSKRVAEETWDRSTLLVAKSIDDEINGNESYFYKIASLLNVKYAILHHDINLTYGNYLGQTLHSPQELQAILNKNYFHYVKSFGPLDLYKIDDNYFRPRIYGTSSAIAVRNISFEQFIRRNDFTLGESVVLSLNGDQPLLDDSQVVVYETSNITLVMSNRWANKAENPEVKSSKIDPPNSLVYVNASEPFFLVFSESFHKDWVAYVDGQQVPDEYHFMANGFANAWYINQTGTFNIVLEFWPQKLFYIGSAISLTTLIFCVFYIGKDKLRVFSLTMLRKK